MSVDLARALEANGIFLRRHRLGEHRAACPRCDRGPRDDALAVRLDDRGATWCCHRCGWSSGRRDALPRAALPRPQARQPEPERYDTLSPWGRRLWTSCRPIELGAVAAAYLEVRGCAMPHVDGDLRWHPGLKHPSGHSGPALVALVTHAETVEPLTLHRTWLAPDGSGKAALDKPRSLLARHSKAGGVVRLWPDDEVTLGLILGEGIESALCGARAFTPAWAAIDAGNLGTFPVLPGIECLTILADHDDAGIRAAETCARRWYDSGAEVRIWRHAALGRDFADFAGERHA